jgi:hypothetical protein
MYGLRVNTEFVPEKDSLYYGKSDYFLNSSEFEPGALSEQISSNSDPKYIVYYHKPWAGLVK